MTGREHSAAKEHGVISPWSTHLKSLKKVSLPKMASVGELFGERSNHRHVSVYIERQLGMCRIASRVFA